MAYIKWEQIRYTKLELSVATVIKHHKKLPAFLDVMLCGIALLSMYSNYWLICTPFPYSGHDWPFLYLRNLSIFNLFMFMFFLLLLLFQ